MPRHYHWVIALALIASGCHTQTVHGGPLLDWLFGGRRTEPAYPVGTPVPLGNGYGAVPGYSANFGNYYGSALPAVGPSGAGYPPVVPQGLSAATLPANNFAPTQPMPLPQPMSYVPNYDSRALRAPVTYYRPIMTTDPNTGAQVVAMAPCTSYQYLTQRVPTFGQSALYGSYQAPQFAPQLQTIPTYTLPSGGIPLAQGVPSVSLPQAALSYGPYAAYQTGLTAPPSMTTPSAVPPAAIPSGPGYATTPMGGSTYYSAPSGGSAGNVYSAPGPGGVVPGGVVPGLSAPPSAPYSSTPSYSTPSYSAPPPSSALPYSPGFSSTPSPSPSNPSMTYPSSPSNPVFPPADPADSVPSLPSYNGLRPQLRSIVPEAGGFGSESAFNGSSLDRQGALESSPEFPVMTPIPAPQGLEKPRWNPGLLREGDMTALRPVTRTADKVQTADFARVVDYAGRSKKIHWASFETSHDHGRSAASAHPQVQDVAPAVHSNPVPSASPTTPRRYDSSGWKVSQ